MVNLEHKVFGLIFGLILGATFFIAHRCIVELHTFENNGTMSQVYLGGQS